MDDDETQEAQTHDVPLEDDPVEPPASTGPKRLVMSRELRGWIAGLSAFVVAAAAITPLIDVEDLRGAINTRSIDALEVADDLTCKAEDQTGGFGGQKVGCAFTCPTDPGSISVSVDADDADAQVSGTADCGDSAHCSGKNKCAGSEVRTSSGPGTCRADSDEAVDSGLYVQCSASVDEIGGGTDIPRDEVCPVTAPVEVCIQPVCAMLPSKSRVDACQQVWQQLVEVLTPYTFAVGFTTGPEGAGLSCQGYICQPFTVET